MSAKKDRTKRRWRDSPSPCIDVCKYNDCGFCKGCGMLKKEKRRFKKLSGKEERRPFIETLIGRLKNQDSKSGGNKLERWVRVYSRKCAKKDVPNPLEKLKLPEPLDGPGSKKV